MAEERTIQNLYKFLYPIFPMIESRNANKKLRVKLENGTGILAYMENADQVTTDQLKAQYDDTVHMKNKLEDKAKTNVMGITIAVTLILGAPNMMDAILKKYPFVAFGWLVFALLMGSVLYLIIAGILSIKVLVAENVLYTIDFSNIVRGGEELKLDCDKRTAQNRTQNLIRNNYIYASYGCVRNALICLFIVLLVSTIPVNTFSTDVGQNRMDSPYSIVYSSNTVNCIGNIATQDSIESLILKAIENHPFEDAGSIVGIIDSTNNLFIQYTLTGETATVNLIEPYLLP